MRLQNFLAVALTLGVGGGIVSAEALCQNQPILTPLAEDTRAQRTLFSLTAATTAAGAAAEQDWLVVLDTRQQRALLFPDPLAGLRTGAASGPGPFLAAARCGDDCFQPIQWNAPGWHPLGYPIEFDPSSTLHFTYDRSGSPWLVFHQLTGRKGILEATAYRWSGETWKLRGRLLVQGVGSPGAASDPRNPQAILSGSGRFDATTDPSYWLPALPVLADSPGGQVIALADKAAAFLTFDNRVTSTTDGSTWHLEQWTPWPNPLGRSDIWTRGVDYSLDRPAGGDSEALRLLWYDNRQRARPALHLTRWQPVDGWHVEATLDLKAMESGAIEYVQRSTEGSWLLIGPCRSSKSASWLDALVLGNGATTAVPLEIPISKGWPE